MLRHLMHHPIKIAIVLGFVLALAVLIRIVIGNPNGAQHRARMLRWRIRLYLRPGPGYANLLELVIRWSRWRAVWIGGRARPSLPWWSRLMMPMTSYAVRLGRAHFGRRVIASMEDQTLLVAPPRKGKSGWLADRIIDHPGGVVTTTTRTDLYENTALLRGQVGELHVFNPEGIGGLASTFRWNPLQGCDEPAIALQRAVAFTSATESKGLHDMTFWIGKASSVLASLLHAAALDGRTMADVYQWAHGIDDAEAERILTAHPGAAGGWLGPIREVRRPGRTADSIRMTVTRALAWLADPTVAAATMPGPDEGFDVAEFVSGRNTLYMIGAGRDEAAIAPLFRAFAEYVHDRATFVGSLQPHGRLDPPMLMALDEVTQICPVPLPSWMADSAGKGILIVAVCHGLAQLEARWDSAGARAIWDTAGIKVVLGGVADIDTLERLSRLCGEISLRMRSHSYYEDGRRARTVTYQPVRVLPPELLRGLPEWRALVIRGNLSPVVVRLRMAWRRQDYRQARRANGSFARPLPSVKADRPEVDWPEVDWPEVEVTDELVPLPPRVESWHFVDTGRETDIDPEELTSQPNSAGPRTVPPWARPPGDVPPPISPSERRPPRPRRPWEPPVDSRDRK